MWMVDVDGGCGWWMWKAKGGAKGDGRLGMGMEGVRNVHLQRRLSMGLASLAIFLSYFVSPD
jgi:hypothetical protein